MPTLLKVVIGLLVTVAVVSGTTTIWFLLVVRRDLRNRAAADAMRDDEACALTQPRSDAEILDACAADLTRDRHIRRLTGRLQRTWEDSRGYRNA